MNRENSRVYRTQVGQAQVLMLSDGHGFFNPWHPVIGAESPRAEVEQACTDWNMPSDGYTPVVAMLVQLNGRTILIDAGSGNTFAPGVGQLPKSLEEAGIDPGDIDTILLTHAHPDHIGGLLTKQGDVQFPNAEIYISDEEKRFWLDDPDLSRATMPPERKAEFIEVAQDRLTRFDDRIKSTSELDGKLPGIETLETFGHTPGHLAFRVRDGGESLLFVGDAIFFTPVLPLHPHWGCALDTDPESGIAARLRLMNLLVDSQERFAATHIAMPSSGRFKKHGSGYLFLPDPWRN